MIQSTLKQFSVQIQYFLLLKEKQGMKREKADFGKMGGNKSMVNLHQKLWEGSKTQGYFSTGIKLKFGRELWEVLKICGEKDKMAKLLMKI